MNRLAREKSAYLRHAAHQKIDWYPWSGVAFERARREDKPVFLSSGASWCHWCHVMAEESFNDEESVKLLNEFFINIKLDRDERPDIDRRYQQAVSAMGAGGGWPLSVFLTPDGKAFYGGTYFPPEDRQGRPGFKSVLKAVSNFYKTRRADAAGYAQQIMDTLKSGTLRAGDLHVSLLDDAVVGILSQFDPGHGGFGTMPKFPMPGSIEYLVRRFASNKNSFTGFAVRATLDAMARGGIHDQLGGGFHRYSTDEAWIVPHFEKMADDNAWLLRDYVHAYSVFGDARYRDVARGIIRFTQDVLSDPAGGFYASQDADVTPGDEGGYFTWTDDDFKRSLEGEEYEALSLHLLHERGSMRHDPSKKVLFIAMEPPEIAEKLGRPLDDVMKTIQRGKEKLFEMRKRRAAPFIDTTLYTSLNGMLITSYLQAYAVLGDAGLTDFAVKSLERVLKERVGGTTLLHSEGVIATLDDYVNLADALAAAYEVTGERRYLAHADRLMEACMEKFFDKNEGGFFDTETELLGARLKRIEDIPHPSGNSMAIMLMLKLSFMTGNQSYYRAAEKTLKIFSRSTQEMSIHAGSYFCALDAYFHMLQLTVEASPSGKLAEAARSLSGPSYTSILYGADRGRVIPCAKGACYEPVSVPEDLKALAAQLYHVVGEKHSQTG